MDQRFPRAKSPGRGRWLLALLALVGCASPRPQPPATDAQSSIETAADARPRTLPPTPAPSIPDDAPQLRVHDEDLDGEPPPSIDPDTLPPLTGDQWTDPEAVAARVVVLLTNHRFSEDGAAVAARLGPYCTSLFRAELAATNTATSADASWAADGAIAVGHVTLTVVDNSDGYTATVNVWATVAVTTGDHHDVPLEPDPYRVLLARQPDGRWLVAGLTP